MSKVTLHYLECRGRGQALRAQLCDAGIEFIDDRHPIENIREAWPTSSQNSERAGPFGSVPVLWWDGFQLAQTLPIATYVDSRLGFDQELSPEDLARARMLTSAAHLDVTLTLGLLVWLPIAHPDTSLEQSFRFTARRIGQKLQQLDAAYPRGTAFAGGTRPCSADFAAFEALDMARDILGSAIDEQLSNCARLSELEAALREREAFRRCMAGAPQQLSASPVEMDARSQFAQWCGT